MSENFREGVIVQPYERLSPQQIKYLDKTSLEILADPGIWCFNERAAKLFESRGAKMWHEMQGVQDCWRVTFPEKLIRDALSTVPSKIVLGARDPQNTLVLDSEVPRIYFGSGSETNVWLETDIREFAAVDDPSNIIKVPNHKRLRGSAELLTRAARLCEQLENLDFFIRPVNIQDEGITEDNHDVNKFFASLNNITKHVQAGLTKLESLPDVIRMAEIIAGGPDALKKNPIISFIACVFKSPLEMVGDTTDKVFSIVEAGFPLVISSSPQGGSSAPIQESGMVAQINAEILAGIALTQLIKPGAPVLYGSVPVRARMDDLHDLYGCPEFNQYNIDCVQLARHYKIPCYSTSGVADAKAPGMQATFEKLFTHMYMAMSGAQYIHYSFGLLDRTNTFSPLQAVLDDEQIGKVKHCVRPCNIDETRVEEALKMVRKVMSSANRLYARHARKAIKSGDVSTPYRFEGKGHKERVIERALQQLHELEARPPKVLDQGTVDTIYNEIKGLLPVLREHAA